MYNIYDAVVIGAGAAGLFCAGSLAQMGAAVTVLEHGAEPGRKILISGGGRCNFTNLDVSAKNFLSSNPHFCKSALAGFTPYDFLALAREAGIAWHEKTLGQLFCDGPAQQILELLLMRMTGTPLHCGVTVREVCYDGLFCVETDKGRFRARNLVAATGGLSIPKLGATDFAYRLARQFGHAIVPPRPALVPLTFEAAWMPRLAGVSAPVITEAGKTHFAENLLFTHRGLSGPAILQISSYLAPGEAFAVNFVRSTRMEEALPQAKRARPKAGLKAVLTEHLPARLATHLAAAHPGNLGDLPDKTLRALGTKLNRFEFVPSGTEGFAKAEVTAGGVDTAGLNSRDCSSRIMPGLYFIGEAVDVTGWLGGYNFQWAWASAHAAAKGIQKTQHHGR
ncbi:aminoacetone oxidase family FAD-binding enzyme [Acidocella sp.]|uniref:NAD(P)/FAD-dependent oxidoreductase n=1 Tax=Acidocella sp. TaxID=50710 RepID=UPI00262E2A1D|nr:aminoacetone oxidase family FAD-binding enzyme [Acidocella sp.]